MNLFYRGPAGWLEADEVRRWSCRGTWAWQWDAGMGACVFEDEEHGLRYIDREHLWRYLCPHPDDLADLSKVPTVEAWCVVECLPDGTFEDATLYGDPESAQSAAAETSRRHLVHPVRVILPLPRPAPLLTVVGEVP